MAKSYLQRSLAYFISASLVLSTSAYAAPVSQPNVPPIQPAVDLSKEIEAAENFHRNYADLEKAGEGQPKSSLAADRFLMMEQTVLPKEVPVVSKFGGHTFRKWRLNTLIAKTEKYLASATAVEDSEDLLTRTKAWFKDYTWLESNRDASGEWAIDPQSLPELNAINDAGQLVAEILKAMRPILDYQPRVLTKEQIASVVEQSTPEAKLEKLNQIMIRASILDHVRNGRRSDTPAFIWDRQKSRTELNTIHAVLKDLQSQWQWNQTNKVLNITDAPTETVARHINWWDTSIEIQEGDRIVKTFAMKDTSAGRNTSGDQPYFCSSSGCRFNILKGNHTLHVYGIQSQVVSTYDQFVVFTHADSYDSATGTQYLHFLDLGAYNGLIGNEEIPVFRLPLKIDEPIRSLTMTGGKLVLNGKYFIEKSAFEQASDWQQVAFNLQTNLVSPNTYAKVLPLVDSVHEFFGRYVDQELKSKADEAEGLRRATVLMPQLAKELQSTLNTQKLMKPLTADEHTKLGQKIAQTAEGEKEAAARLDLYHSRVSKSAELADAMSQTQERARVSRQFGARIRLLAGTLLSPRPHMSQKLKEALGSWYVRHPDANGKLPVGTQVMDRLLALTNRPYVNSGVIAAGIMAVTLPDSFANLVHAGLGVSTALLDYVTGMLSGVGGAVKEGTGSTFASVTTLVSAPFTGEPSALATQYINNGRWWKTGVGLSAFAMFLGTIYFVPHMLFNYMELKKDLGGKVFRWGGIEAFKKRQSAFRDAYFQRLAQDEAENRRVENPTFDADEEREIQEYLDQRYAALGRQRPPGLQGSQQDVKETVNAALEDQTEAVGDLVESAGESTAVAKSEKLSDNEFKDFSAAFKHFAFSMPALELTLEKWASIWNWWAGWRFTTVGFGFVNVLGSDIPLYIKAKPVSFVTRLLYPEFLERSIFTRKGRVAIPTDMNGGLRVRGTRLMQRCSRTFQEACHLMGFNSTEESLDPKKQLAALKAFEAQIVQVEDQVNEIAFRQSLENLPKFMKSKEDLRKLFNSKSLDTITQKDILQLTWESKTFLRAHFESIYQAAMTKFVGETLTEEEIKAAAVAAEQAASGDNSNEVAPTPEEPARVLEVAAFQPSPQQPNRSGFDIEQENAQRTLSTMKRALVKMKIEDGEAADYNFNLEAAKSAALSVADDPVHYKNAEAAVAAGRLSPTNFGLNSRFNLVSDMDPRQNPSMRRLETVHERLQRPGALGRAVRAEISKLRYTLWVDLSFKLLLSAGVMHGSMQPVFDQFYSKDSIAYLSSTSFYMMMGAGFLMSLMADAWIKLQQDAVQDERGQFGAIPRGEDAQRSFFQWYRKQFNSNENSLFKNWGASNYLAFWNLPAALTNIALFNFMFSGRLDLSLLLAGYSLTFTTPLSAFHYKVDQAFERAAHFAARGVKDEKWLAHPDVQQLLVPETQRYRDRFTLINDIYGNVQGNWIGNIEMIPTELGPRGFQRALFGGGLLEEYIVTKALDPLASAVAGVPVLDHVLTPLIKSCETLLTFRNGDLRIPGH